MEWQPIETAPRDGTRILVVSGGWHDVAYVGWNDDDGEPVWFNGDVPVQASHWMPLPAPPPE